MTAPRLIALGVVARAHGIRGEVRVKLFNPASDLLFEQRRVWLRREGEVREIRVRQARPEREAALLVLDGIEDRDQADALRGSEVCVPREMLPALEPGEIYFADVEGLPARTPDGADAGQVVRVVEYPTAQCLLLRSTDGDREVPMVEPYLVRVDLDGGFVVVDRLEDLPPERPRR